MFSDSDLAKKAMESLGFSETSKLSASQANTFKALFWSLKKKEEQETKSARKDPKAMTNVIHPVFQAMHDNSKTESPLEDLLLFAMNSRSLLIGEFKTQYSVGSYRLDFAFPHTKLCVEADGKQHRQDPGQIAHDQRRTAYLSKLGWTVIRFTWAQVRNEPYDCADRIAKVHSNLMRSSKIKEPWER